MFYITRNHAHSGRPDFIKIETQRTSDLLLNGNVFNMPEYAPKIIKLVEEIPEIMQDVNKALTDLGFPEIASYISELDC